MFFHFSQRQPILGWKLPSHKFSQVEVASKSCQPHPDRTVGESGFPWDSGNLLWIQRKSLRKSRLTIKAVGPTWIYHRRGKTLSPPWWIRGLFPHRSVSEVPPRAIPWWWNDPLSAGLQTSQEALPCLRILRPHGPASLFPWLKSLLLAPVTWRNGNYSGGSEMTQIQQLCRLYSLLSCANQKRSHIAKPCLSGGSVSLSGKSDEKRMGSSQKEISFLENVGQGSHFGGLLVIVKQKL